MKKLSLGFLSARFVDTGLGLRIERADWKKIPIPPLPAFIPERAELRSPRHGDLPSGRS